MRVVIDTNIWISYLLGGLLKELDEWILSRQIRVVVSEGLLKKFIEVKLLDQGRSIQPASSKITCLKEV